MNPLTTNSPPPPPVAAPANPNEHLAKRKRGRPRKEEVSHVNHQQPEEDLVGKMVSGVVEGSVDAGYLLNLKVKDSDKKLRGVVFIPGKVAPVTPENDVAPGVKMYQPTDKPMKDAEIAGSSRALVPIENNGKAVHAKEAMVEKDGAMDEVATRLVEFFPTPVTTMVTQPQPNLILSQKETEQQKSSGDTTRGLELMEAEKVVGQGEKVPEMLQLELGNKAIVSGDNNNNIVTTETIPEEAEKTNPEASVSKSGFIANLFDGGDKKEVCNMEEGKEATTPSVK